MPLTDRDCSLVEHLAVRVMGWRWVAPRGRFEWTSVDGETHWVYHTWNPLKDPEAMMQVWERAREMGILAILKNQGVGYDWYAQARNVHEFRQQPINVFADSGPAAITEAIALATGWKDLTNAQTSNQST